MEHSHQIDAAAYHGLRTMGDIDPDVARDLGYPVTPEDVERHVQAGRQVKRRIGAAALTANDSDEHARLEARYGRIRCATCARPGCNGCGA